MKATKPAKKQDSTPAPLETAKAGSGPAIEDVYVKKTHLEQILLRPDTYIGSTEKLTQSMLVFDGEAGFRTRDITYVPGLFKIFDEILGSFCFGVYSLSFAYLTLYSQRVGQQAARPQHEHSEGRHRSVC